jgi:EAL domain-containing protein (putative c-di-GMP-specific phosphodiesterase class I)
MQCTAEGVETQEQLDSVRSEGCTEMQGFLLSKPLPAGQINDLFEKAKQTNDRDLGQDLGKVA